jgi:hypothetical protein
VLQQQWKNAGTGEKLVVLGAGILAAAWLIGVVVNGLWFAAAGAQTFGILAVLAAIVAMVIVFFNGASDGKLPSHYGATILALSLVMVAFVGLSAWSVFSLNGTMKTFSDCAKQDAAACNKIAGMSVSDQIHELLLTSDSAGVSQKTIADGESSLTGLVNYATSQTPIPSMPASVWIATVGLLLGAAAALWGAFMQWTIDRAAAA